jgi:O-antigen ligase
VPTLVEVFGRREKLGSLVLADVAWMLALATVPTDGLFVVETRAGTYSLNRVCVGVACALTIGQLVKVRTWRPAGWWTSALLAYLGIAFVSTVWAVDPVLARSGAVVIGLYALAAMLLVQHGTTEGRVRAMAVAYATGAVLGAVLIVAGEAANLSFASEIRQAQTDRATLGLSDQNGLAIMFALAIVIVAWLRLPIAGRRPLTNWLMLPAIASLSLAIYLTGSRGGLVAGMAGAAALLWSRPTGLRLKIGLGAVISVGLLLVVGVSSWSGRFNLVNAPSEARHNADLRVELWGRAWDYFVSHPVQGIGYRSFPTAVSPLYGKAYAPHSTVMGTAAELGLLGLAALVVLALTSLNGSARRRIRRSNFADSMPALALIIVVVLAGAGLTLDIHTKKIFFYGLALAYSAATLGRSESGDADGDGAQDSSRFLFAGPRARRFVGRMTRNSSPNPPT